MSNVYLGAKMEGMAARQTKKWLHDFEPWKKISWLKEGRCIDGESTHSESLYNGILHGALIHDKGREKPA